MQIRVRAGLFGLQAPSDVPRVEGLGIVSGAFAVPKDDLEDRPIAPLERLNSLVSSAVLEPIEFPYLPQLITVDIPKDRKIKIYVSKRDARHYYPSLSAAPAWHQWFSMPSLRINGEVLHPVHRTWPMGFRGSCMFAQAITETVCLRADLPKSCRLTPSVPTPSTLPIWGAILDDVWVLRSNEEDTVNQNACTWLGRVDHEWASVGVASHPSKRVDDACGAEIQGAYVDSETHTVSLSHRKLLTYFWRGFGYAVYGVPTEMLLHALLASLGLYIAFGPRCVDRSVLCSST